MQIGMIRNNPNNPQRPVFTDMRPGHDMRGHALLAEKGGGGVGLEAPKNGGAHSPNLKISSKTFRFNKPIPKFFLKTL
jgi:hypothetical protein